MDFHIQKGLVLQLRWHISRATKWAPLAVAKRWWWTTFDRTKEVFQWYSVMKKYHPQIIMNICLATANRFQLSTDPLLLFVSLLLWLSSELITNSLRAHAMDPRESMLNKSGLMSMSHGRKINKLLSTLVKEDDCTTLCSVHFCYSKVYGSPV